MDALWRIATSMRTTAGILSLLALLMLLNVLVPQEATQEAAYRELLSSGPFARFWLETVGLGHVSTSRVFLLLLSFFFFSLIAVVGDRMAATLRRARAAPPTPAAVASMSERDSLEIAAEPPLARETARRVLEGLGYRAVSVGERAIWAVKHPAAVMGFPLFHLSFVVLCAGGALIYYTRQVAAVTVVEGQSFEESDLRLLRKAPWGGAPLLRMTLEQVDVGLVDGQPTRLAVMLRSEEPERAIRVTRVNRPAEWGALAVLVTGAGVAPVLALRDTSGFTQDRVAVVVGSRRDPVTVKLLEGAVAVELEPVPVGPDFPERDALASARLGVVVREGETIVYRGRLKPRTPVPVGPGFVEIDEVRYWASLYLVHERGGGLLVAGFALLVVGIIWRMSWFRREVVVVWDGTSVRLAGRGEFYPARFRAELERIRSLLQDPGSAGIRGDRMEEAR